MNWKTKSILALAASTAVSCVDVEPVSDGEFEARTREQTVVVVPEFAMTGAENTPDDLLVTDLGLSISEIRLEPIATPDSLAFSTREPFFISFDVGSGETVRALEPVELPTPGRYLVSIRLEPLDHDGSEPSSFAMKGFVAGERRVTGADLGSRSDGRPQPMPFDSTQGGDTLRDKQAYPMQWTPFEYHSKRAVFYTYTDVAFESGTQRLRFSFDVRDWAVDVAEPIADAIENTRTANDSVDVTNEVDRSGAGVDALLEASIVHTDPIPVGE